MTRGKKELKEFIKDDRFIEQMNSAFADLRADFELELDAERSKISELKEVHVDIKNCLSNLSSYCCKSSGLVSGLRGTGKTHLMLLARDKVNENFQENKTLCIYINLKRLHLPSNFDQELFNRVFGIFFYNELSKQLISILRSLEADNVLDKFKLLFKKDEKALILNVREVIQKIALFKQIIRAGSEEFANYKEGEVEVDISERELLEIQSKISTKLSQTSGSIAGEFSIKESEEKTDKTKTKATYINYLNIQDIRNNLISLIKLLKVSNLTFYVDEWEKIFTIDKAQEYLSFFVDKLNDTPLYFWIGYVPFRGELYHLDVGADLQHQIDLDKNLIYENSKLDKDLCISYFKSFINRRMEHYLKDYGIDYRVMFNDDRKFEILVLGSMGNSRDFGTMLLKCWSDFRDYRNADLVQGRPYKYISSQMIANSIKDDGDKKLLNIKYKEKVMSIWRDVENYAVSKKSSHIAVEESNENMSLMSTDGFSDLLYHRLLHFRKGHVPPKDSIIDNKLSIYALNYACTYDQHTRDKKITFITSYSSIHDRVRRYIYNPKIIIDSLKLKDGEIHPCISCGNNINVRSMTAAWEKNSCPFCGDKIYKE